MLSVHSKYKLKLLVFFSAAVICTPVEAAPVLRQWGGHGALSVLFNRQNQTNNTASESESTMFMFFKESRPEHLRSQPDNHVD